MYPNQNQPQYPNDGNQQQPQYSIDYLNEISAKPQKTGMGNKFFFLIVAGGIFVALMVGLIMLMSSGNGPTQKMQTLAARLITLQEIAKDSQKKIKSGELRSTNSNLSIFLTNTNRDIVEPLEKNGVKVSKIDKTITAKEANEELIQRLEDARLNAIFDRTYAREMSYQLETTAALIKDIYGNTKSASLKTFLETTDSNLQPIKKQLGDFNATNS